MEQSNSRSTSVEVNVDQAATLLGTSERTVLNYIKARQIKASKVGKRWFVDRESLEQFNQTGGRGLRAFPSSVDADFSKTAADSEDAATRIARRFCCAPAQD